MFNITIRSNMDAVMRDFRNLGERDVKLAAAKALTFTGERVMEAEVGEIYRVFDRPKPYTINSLYLKPATPNNLAAKVLIKDRGYASHGGTAAADYLAPEVDGGPRNQKRFEKALIANGLMPAGMYAVPGQRAALDRYGNLSQGLIQQILSALGAAERTAGYLANRTKRSAKRGKKVDYFVGQPGNGKGPLGIWQRVGRGARPIIIYVKQPSYAKRFDFYGVAERTVDRYFAKLFRERLTSAVAKRSI